MNGADMGRYLDPKADIVFKKIFQQHPELLKSFLNAVLPLDEGHEIVELEYLPSEQVPVIPCLKHTIADVRCKDKTGRTFIVEMQIEWTTNFKKRLLFEASQAYIKQLEKGENFHLLEPVYGLGIIATDFDSTSTWYHHYQLVNVEKPQREIIDGLQLIFIELKKFPVDSPDAKRLRLLWLRFLREIHEKTRKVDPELLAVREIAQAMDLAEEAAYSEGELATYDAYWLDVSTQKTLMHGRYQEGIVEGEAKGEAKGRAAERHEIAQRLLAQGMDAEWVANLLSS